MTTFIPGQEVYLHAEQSYPESKCAIVKSVGDRYLITQCGIMFDLETMQDCGFFGRLGYTLYKSKSHYLQEFHEKKQKLERLIQESSTTPP